ncbi:MAG TPA: tetratricopeptide repeat protein, partial [Pyrinomonadaceae bacterium]|nr:tetratricopeptide repeat protein [Pyrinomonadaceae bacterium]
MAFDKAKVVRAAEKFLAQGKIPAAIKEYRQIVENDPEDFTALNMLGDLYARQNDKQQAMQCFLRIAEHYREEGFQSKAIAMYKKVDRLNPRSPEIANKLAGLYESQGLIVDARAQYMIIAEAWLRDGQSRKALEILRKVADLDPQNTEARVKLAQGYMREGMQAEAAEAFSEAGSQFLTQGAHERGAECFTASLDLRPRDYGALSGFLNTQIALGTPEDAAEVLEKALEASPDDVELLSMLAQAYIEADDAEAAERAVGKLVAAESSHYGRFVDVARLYLKADEADDAVRVLSSITEQMLSGREDETLMELLNEVLSRDPEHVEALRLLVRVHAWQRDDEKQHQALERLAEAAEAAGLPDVERSALLQLAQFAPDQRYLERLHALGHAGATPEPDARAGQQEEAAAEEDVPSFESFALMGEEPSSTADAMGMPAAETTEFEFNSVAPPAQQQQDPSASFADLNEDWASSSDAFAGAQPPAAPAGGFQEYEFTAAEPAAATDAGGQAGAPTTPGAADPRHEAVLRQELDSVDFYLDQGYLDIAADTLDMLERQFGAHAEIDSRRARLGPAAPQAAPAQPAAAVEFEGFASYDVAEEVPAIEPDSFVEVREVQPEPAPPQQQPPEPAPPAAPMVQPGIDPGLAAIFDEFR